MRDRAGGWRKSHTIRRTGLLCAAFAAVGCVSAHAQAVTWLDELQRQDQRVASIGWRLSSSAARYCARTAMASGIGLHDVSQYARKDQAAADQRFDFGGNLAVLSVAAGSPADRAGVRPGDALLAIDGQPLPPADGRAMSVSRTETATRQLAAAAAHGRLTVSLSHAGTRRDVTIDAVPICPPRYLVVSRGSPNAWTDGADIAVTYDLLRIAADDGEVAAVMAHELAHVIARQAAHASGPPADRRWAEDAADRLSVRLMIGAGYDPHAALRLWSRLGKRDPFGFLPSATHGGVRARIRTITAQIEAMARGGE